MARAFLFVLDSFGIGGAADAARFGDVGSDTFGHIAAACAAGGGDREGLRNGPLDLPNMTALGLGRAAKLASGSEFGADGGAVGRRLFRCRAGSVERQGHALGSLGNRRRPGPLRLGLFSADGAGVSGRADRRHHSRGRGARHPRRLPRLRHRDHRATRRGACPDRQADLLHLRRTRSSRSPRTRRISGWSGSTSSARSCAASSTRSTSAGSSPVPSSARARRASSAPPTAATMPSRRPSRRCSTG